MNKIELVIFDMDGLIFNTEELTIKSWQEAGKLNNYNISKEFLLSLLGMNKKSIKLQFEKYFNDKFEFEYMYNEHERFLNKIIDEGGLRTKKGLNELLGYLTENKIKKAVATSSSRKRTEKFLSKAGILNIYDGIVCGDEVTESKPNPEIFLKTCKKLNVKPSNAIVLEDSERGLEAAISGGIKCILIPDLVEPSKRHSKLAYAKVKNLSEIIDLRKLFV